MRNIRKLVASAVVLLMAVTCAGLSLVPSVAVAQVSWPPYSGFTSLSLGDDHTCTVALRTGRIGVVTRVGLCWGSNRSGQLGNGTTTNASTAVEVRLPGAPNTISAGANHTCAVIAKTVWCWGDNSYGQLGDGTTNSSSLPVQVQNLPSTPVQVELGSKHTCALTSRGVFCWGDNTSGQLGNGSFVSSLLPTAVKETGFFFLSAGGSTTCGLKDVPLHPLSSVWVPGVLCWGANGYGQLGIGALGDRNVPVSLGTLGGTGARTVSVGADHVCSADNAGGFVFCSGRNLWGQIGDGTQMDRWTPTTGFYPAQDSVGAGLRHTCSKAHFATPVCWGSNDRGQLGNGTISKGSWTPVTVKDLPSLSSMSAYAGGSHSCAIDAAFATHVFKRVWCWGANDLGQIGDGTFDDRANKRKNKRAMMMTLCSVRFPLPR